MKKWLIVIPLLVLLITVFLIFKYQSLQKSAKSDRVITPTESVQVSLDGKDMVEAKLRSRRSPDRVRHLTFRSPSAFLCVLSVLGGCARFTLVGYQNSRAKRIPPICSLYAHSTNRVTGSSNRADDPTVEMNGLAIRIKMRLKWKLGWRPMVNSRARSAHTAFGLGCYARPARSDTGQNLRSAIPTIWQSKIHIADCPRTSSAIAAASAGKASCSPPPSAQTR